MRTSKVAFLLLVAIALASSAPHLMAGIIPPIGLAPGQQYQLVFVTNGSIDGTSGTEAPYNVFVNAEASLNSMLPSTTWHAVTSTIDGTNANVNAPWLGLPVYNSEGIRVSNPTSSFYASPHEAAISYDQFGNLASSFLVWTGGLPDAFNGEQLFTLGEGGLKTTGRSDVADSRWIDSVRFFQGSFHVYALSGAIMVPTPEPSSLILGLFAAAGLALVAIRKRRVRR